jgi:hypothetical protein
MNEFNVGTEAVRFISLRGYVYDVTVEAIWQHFKNTQVEKGRWPDFDADDRLAAIKKAEPDLWLSWTGDVIEWSDVAGLGILVSKEVRNAERDSDPFDCMVCLDSVEPRTFILGNCLRGCYQGQFTSMSAAWKVLSARFLKSFPNKGGLMVSMWVREKNHYGIEDTLICKQGVTSLEGVSDAEMAQCVSSFHRG